MINETASAALPSTRRKRLGDGMLTPVRPIQFRDQTRRALRKRLACRCGAGIGSAHRQPSKEARGPAARSGHCKRRRVAPDRRTHLWRVGLEPEPSSATFARCDEPILSGELWDLDHDDSDPLQRRYLGPSHASSEGGLIWGPAVPRLSLGRGDPTPGWLDGRPDDRIRATLRRLPDPSDASPTTWSHTAMTSTSSLTTSGTRLC